MNVKERGLEPLAEQLLAARGTGESAQDLAKPFINQNMEVKTPDEALTGAGHILAEQFADVAEARATVRELTWQKGLFCSQPARGKEETVSKFEMYYDFSEPLRQIPSHRMLAMRPGEKEEELRLRIESPEEEILSRLSAFFVTRKRARVGLRP